jgi:DNA-binding response OmpR family regulator
MAEQAQAATPSPYHEILVVEDEDVFRRILVRNLERRGHVVRQATTAADALAAVAEGRPDLLLLDISLPDRSGWDVLRALREEGLEVPTVIVSAVRVTPDRLAMFSPVAYLPKPFPLEALLRIVSGEQPAEEWTVGVSGG